MAQFEWQSPYERLFGRAPYYSHLRNFGCFCFTTKVISHKDNFDVKYIKVVLIRYAYNHKAYKLHDLVNHTFIVSRDVVFHEPQHLRLCKMLFYLFQSQT